MKVLFVGNSFSNDATRYLQFIAGEELFVRNLYIGGCSLERHYNNLVGEEREYNDTKNEITSYFFSGGEYREFGHRKIYPVSLSDEILENIYYNNAMRFIKKK